MICNIVVTVILVAAPFKALAMLAAAPGHDHGRRDLANAEGHPRTLGGSSVIMFDIFPYWAYISESYLGISEAFTGEPRTRKTRRVPSGSRKTCIKLLMGVYHVGLGNSEPPYRQFRAFANPPKP